MLRSLALAFLLAASPALAQTINAPTIDASASIAAGNTFQIVLAAVGAPPAIRRSLTIQNNNVNGDSCWIYPHGDSATKAKSILLLPGGSYTRYYPYVPSDAVQATCTTTADTLYVDTQ